MLAVGIVCPGIVCPKLCAVMCMATSHFLIFRSYFVLALDLLTYTLSLPSSSNTSSSFIASPAAVTSQRTGSLVVVDAVAHDGHGKHHESVHTGLTVDLVGVQRLVHRIQCGVLLANPRENLLVLVCYIEVVVTPVALSCQLLIQNSDMQHWATRACMRGRERRDSEREKRERERGREERDRERERTSGRESEGARVERTRQHACPRV